MSLEQLKRLQVRIARLEREAKTERYRELMSDVKEIRNVQRHLLTARKALESANSSWRTVNEYAQLMHGTSDYHSASTAMFKGYNHIDDSFEPLENLSNALNEALKMMKEEMTYERDQ